MNNKNDENKKELSKTFLVLKIVGIVMLIFAVVCFIVSFANFGNFDNHNYIIFAGIGGFSFVVGFACLSLGFAPSFQKFNIKMARQIQEENKDDLKQIADTNVEITGNAATQHVRNIKKGLKDFKYCKHCGSEIDIDSKFCSNCGKEQ